MENFILLGRPNFILVELAEEEPAATEDAPIFLNRTFADILSAMGVRSRRPASRTDSGLTGSPRRCCGRCWSTTASTATRTRWASCAACSSTATWLDVLTGAGLHDAQLLEQWQRVMQGLVAARKTHPHQAAVELYGRGDLASLLSWHREQATLTQLGQTYRFVPGRETARRHGMGPTASLRSIRLDGGSGLGERLAIETVCTPAVVWRLR